MGGIFVLLLIIGGVALILNIFNLKSTYTKPLNKNYTLREIYELMLDIKVEALENEVQRFTIENNAYIKIYCRYANMTASIEGKTLSFRYNLKIMTNAKAMVMGFILIVFTPAMSATFVTFGGIVDVEYQNAKIILLMVVFAVSGVTYMYRSRKKALNKHGAIVAERIARYIY